MMTPERRKTVRSVAIALLALGASGSLAVFAVPLYQLFCQVTGYGGTTQRAEGGGREVLERTISVRFDGTVDSSLAWRFEPLQATQRVKIGETALAFYRATNTGDRPITGQATYNVTPHKAGQYFRKVECFCFTEQTLEPGETAKMPVTYFIDPAIAEDANLDGVHEVTLSYTFFFRDYADTQMAAGPAGNARESNR